ncbi:MAG: uncharacterized protein KVP18_001711 [Porospora cf. gigantea A]|uniref:uncharacterized protein n=2 Tax=Porospora cf. gigantea A TaxID=2853593 RepID=UPI0035598DB3|nr:MAG: hypothetical protein KVP18_001711 [Porospora cf. gigantea A]
MSKRNYNFDTMQALRLVQCDMVTDNDVMRSEVDHKRIEVDRSTSPWTVRQVPSKMAIKTQLKVPKVGAMVIGLGGNNGTTFFAGQLANKNNLTWRTRTGPKAANWYGSVLNTGVMKLGCDAATGEDVHVPMKSVVPLLNPDDLVIGGWDINTMALGDAMRRAEVLNVNLQDQLYDDMQKVSPLKGIYIRDFIAENQVERANHVKEGSLSDLVQQVRADIREFKENNNLDKVIVLWSANTERFVELEDGVHDSAENLLTAIKNNHTEISASIIYAVAAIQEGSTYINGSPQNTFVPGIVELASQYKTYIAGDDFKSGQTKFKSVLTDFLVSAAMKPTSIVSYNHLGNNDGRNLSSAKQFRSKEISKSNVVDDMVNSNRMLYKEGEHPDHVVVIKYVPNVGDSKRALDEYTSEIFMGGLNTIVVHNTCEDSLLAVPLMMDLIQMAEFCERISVEREGTEETFHTVLSLLSYFCKAPVVPKGQQVVNSLFTQREAITNFFRACVGLAPESHLHLETRLASVTDENAKPL